MLLSSVYNMYLLIVGSFFGFHCIPHYYPHSGGILGCHANVDFQHTNYLLNVTICEKLRCAHKLQTISDAFSHIASRFVKVALAIKFALNWLAGPQCDGERVGCAA